MLYVLIAIFALFRMSVCYKNNEALINVKIRQDVCNDVERAYVMKAIGNRDVGDHLCSTWNMDIGEMPKEDVFRLPEEDIIGQNRTIVHAFADTTNVSVGKITSEFQYTNTDIDEYRNIFAHTFFTLGSVWLKSICFRHYYTHTHLGCAKPVTEKPSCDTKYTRNDKSAKENDLYNDISFCYESTAVVPLYEYLQLDLTLMGEKSGYWITQYLYTWDWQKLQPHAIADLLKFNKTHEIAQKWRFQCDVLKLCKYMEIGHTYEIFELDAYRANKSVPMFTINEQSRDAQPSIGIHVFNQTEHYLIITSEPLTASLNENISVSFNYSLSYNLSFCICVYDEDTHRWLHCSSPLFDRPEEIFNITETTVDIRMIDTRPGKLDYQVQKENFKIQIVIESPDDGILLLTNFLTSGFQIRPDNPPKHEDYEPMPPIVPGTENDPRYEPLPTNIDCNYGPGVDYILETCMDQPVICPREYGFKMWHFDTRDRKCKPNYSCVNTLLHNAFSFQEACEMNCLTRYIMYVENREKCSHDFYPY